MHMVSSLYTSIPENHPKAFIIFEFMKQFVISDIPKLDGETSDHSLFTLLISWKSRCLAQSLPSHVVFVCTSTSRGCSLNVSNVVCNLSCHLDTFLLLSEKTGSMLFCSLLNYQGYEYKRVAEASIKELQTILPMYVSACKILKKG